MSPTDWEAILEPVLHAFKMAHWNSVTFFENCRQWQIPLLLFYIPFFSEGNFLTGLGCWSLLLMMLYSSKCSLFCFFVFSNTKPLILRHFSFPDKNMRCIKQSTFLGLLFLSPRGKIWGVILETEISGMVVSLGGTIPICSFAVTA